MNARAVQPLPWRALAAAAAFVVMTSSSTSTSAVFLAYRTQWGLTTADIGIVFSAYVGTLLPVLLLFGGFADRFGRRPVITAGILFMVTGMVTLTLAHGLPALLLARFFQGIGAGLAGGALSAAFSESYRGKIPVGNALQSVTAIGLAVGPVITAIAFNLGGGANRSYLPMLVLSIAILALTPFLGAPAARAGAPVASEEPFSADVVWAGLRFAMPLVFVSWASLSLYLSLVPSYLAGALHVANPLIGAGAFVAAQLASLVATTRLGHTTPERIGTIAPAVMLGGLALLVAGTSANLWPAIVLATILVGAGGGAASAASFAIAGRVGRGQRARIFARLFVAAYLGYSLPSLATGIIAVHATLAIGLTCVIVVLGLIVAALPLLRERPTVPACTRPAAAL
jgi:MFS family permease